MSGSRRTQRSVRVVVAMVVMIVAAGGVVASIVADGGLVIAAIAAVVAGAVAVRIMYTEVVETRRSSAADRAGQAKSFADALATKQAEHTEFTMVMSARLAGKDRTIRELEGTVRLADKRADDAEDRVKRESKRANEAQSRLAELVDGVLSANVDGTGQHVAVTDVTDLPTIVDLLAWEDRIDAESLEDLRKHA